MEEYQKLEIASDYGLAKAAEDHLVGEAEACGHDEEVVFGLRLSLEEALSNAIRHGNKQDRDKKVRIHYRINPERIDIYVEDEGEGFNPQVVPDPTAEDNLENPCGRGIMLMRAYMNHVEYNAAGNKVHLVKLRHAG